MTDINIQTATAEDLAKINQYARKELKAEDIYVFNVNLCNNDIDRDYEKFSVASLYKMAELFVGKTGISNHSMRSEDQKARIFETSVERIEGKKTLDNEDFYVLRAKAYMLNNEDNKNLIAEIDAGIKKEVSISCSMASSVCAICGKDVRKERCNHITGKNYDGKLCYRTLEKPTDAYEFSFVAVPAQREAGVSKAFSMNNKSIEQKINDGRHYRSIDDWSYKDFELNCNIAEFEKEHLISSNNECDVYEVIKKGAFDNCDCSDVIMQYDHQGKVFSRVKNKTLLLSIEEIGLKMVADLSQCELGTTVADEINKGFADQMAFGFSIGKDETIYEYNKETGRTKITHIIYEIKKIFDVSVTSVPTNDATMISVRSFADGAISESKKEFLKNKNQRADALAKIKLIKERNCIGG